MATSDLSGQATRLASHPRGAIRQLLDFGGVGAIGTVIKLLLMYVLTDWLGLHYMVSYALSFAVVVTHNYLLNSVWTFRYRLSAPGLGRYLLVSCVSAGARAVIVFLLTDVVGIWYMMSTIMAILIGFLLNFAISRRWVWFGAVRQ
jgi:putative flippase GtrA